MKKVYIVIEEDFDQRACIQGVFENEKDAYILAHRLIRESSKLNYYVKSYNIN